MTTAVLRPAAGHYADHIVWAPDGTVALTVAVGPVPPRSPYQAGDWVCQHGYGGYPRTWPAGYGWRGHVIGSLGNTILWGLTDDGRTWAEHWGALQPDGQPNLSAAACLCHPHPRSRSDNSQPALFDLAEVDRC